MTTHEFTPKQMLIIRAALEQYQNLFEIDKLFDEAHQVQIILDFLPGEDELFEAGLEDLL